MKRINYTILLLLVLAACKKERTMYTASGMKYLVYTDSKGIKPVLGDYVTFEMVYKTEKDSVLFDSRRNDSPFRIQLLSIPFAGSLEEGLTCLSEGDSATFFVSADSLRANMLRKHLEAGRETLLRPGSFAKFDVRLVRVQRKADAEAEIAQNMRRKLEEEPRLIREYLERKHLQATPDSHGIYAMGPQTPITLMQDGDTVAIRYTGMYLNGRPFFSNRNAKEPMQFVLGKGDVIPAWEKTLRRFQLNATVTMIVPSAQAYGEKGYFSAARGNYLVPPHTPLAYEIEIVSVKKGSRK